MRFVLQFGAIGQVHLAARHDDSLPQRVLGINNLVPDVAHGLFKQLAEVRVATARVVGVVLAGQSCHGQAPPWPSGTWAREETEETD
jgi:hypothetical protein